MVKKIFIYGVENIYSHIYLVSYHHLYSKAKKIMIIPGNLFFGALFYAIYYFYFESIDPHLKPKDTLPDDLRFDYDFVIVGGGSAGCVVANRLSENKNWKILLIEAGGDETALSDVPSLLGYLRGTELDWNFTSVEQKKTCRAINGICRYGRGRVLGGSSTMNAMFYVRGNKADFNEWADLGNKDWSYSKVLPYFIKSENASRIQLRNSVYHGSKGPLSVQYPNYYTPLRDLFIKATIECGLKPVDYNGLTQEGVGRPQVTMRDRSRCSSAKAFLNPIRNRKNLHISKHSEVIKLEIDKKTKRANGVWFVRNSIKYFVRASKEVILSAGTINSPKILLLSGIGPKKHLKSLGIPRVVDLPVGQNLQDHLANIYYFSVNKSLGIISSDIHNTKAVTGYAKYGQGPLTTQALEAVGFVNVLTDAPPANTQFILGATSNVFGATDDKCIITCIMINVKPLSRGTVKLSSKDPKSPPLIDPNFLNEEIDFKITKRGIKRLMTDLMTTPTMKSLSAQLYTDNHPNCNQFKDDLDKYIDCSIREYGQTACNPTGTVKMGPKRDKTSVVNSNLMVHGFKNLRVIDSSIMPTITRGNTNAPAIMIGEKGSDIIKKSYDRRIK